MLKIILPLSILLSFLVGVFFGTRATLDSLLYYDAPIKIKVLSLQLDNIEESRSIPFGEVIHQVRILNEPEKLKFKTPLILKFFPDGDLVASEFNKFYPEIDQNIHYQEAFNFLCKWNEEYKDECNK